MTRQEFLDRFAAQVFATLRALVLAELAAGDTIEMRLITTTTDAEGKTRIDGVPTPVKGRVALTIGQDVPVLFRAGRPRLVLAYLMRRASADFRRAGTLDVEELALATVSGSPTTYDVWYRNPSQATALGLGATFTGTPLYVRWGEDGRQFAVVSQLSTGPVDARGQYVQVYSLGRAAHEILGPRMAAATLVKRVKVPRIKLLERRLSIALAGNRIVPVQLLGDCLARTGATTASHARSYNAEGTVETWNDGVADVVLAADGRVIGVLPTNWTFGGLGAARVDYALTGSVGGGDPWSLASTTAEDRGIGGGAGNVSLLDLESQTFLWRGGPAVIEAALAGPFDDIGASAGGGGGVAQLTTEVSWHQPVLPPLIDTEPDSLNLIHPFISGGSASGFTPLDGDTVSVEASMGVNSVTVTEPYQPHERFMGLHPAAVTSLEIRPGSSTAVVSTPDSAHGTGSGSPSCDAAVIEAANGGVTTLRINTTENIYTTTGISYGYRLTPLVLPTVANPTAGRFLVDTNRDGRIAADGPVTHAFGLFLIDGAGTILRTIRPSWTLGSNFRVLGVNRFHVLWEYRDPTTDKIKTFLTDLATGAEKLVADDTTDDPIVRATLAGLIFLSPDFAYLLRNDPAFTFSKAWERSGAPTLTVDPTAADPETFLVAGFPPPEPQLAPYGTLKKRPTPAGTTWATGQYRVALTEPAPDLPGVRAA